MRADLNGSVRAVGLDGGDRSAHGAGAVTLTALDRLLGDLLAAALVRDMLEHPAEA